METLRVPRDFLDRLVPDVEHVLDGLVPNVGSTLGGLVPDVGHILDGLVPDVGHILDGFVPNVERHLDNAGSTLLRIGKIASRVVFAAAILATGDTLVGIATANRPAEVVEISTDSYKNNPSYDPDLVTLVFPTFGNRDNGCKAAEHSGAQKMGRVMCIKFGDNSMNIQDITQKVDEKLGFNKANAKPVKVITLAESTGGMVAYLVDGKLVAKYPKLFIPEGFILDSCETGVDDVSDSKKSYVTTLPIMPGGRAATFAQQSLDTIVNYGSSPFDVTTWSNTFRVTAEFSLPELRLQAAFINQTKLTPNPRLANIPMTYLRDGKPINDEWVDTLSAPGNWRKLGKDVSVINLTDSGHAGLVNKPAPYGNLIETLIRKYNNNGVNSVPTTNFACDRFGVPCASERDTYLSASVASNVLPLSSGHPTPQV